MISRGSNNSRVRKAGLIICPGFAQGRLTEFRRIPNSGVEQDSLVVFVENLRPEMIIKVIERRPAAVLSANGGITAHGASLLREANIPSLSDIHPGVSWFGKGVKVDAYEGTIERTS